MDKVSQAVTAISDSIVGTTKAIVGVKDAAAGLKSGFATDVTTWVGDITGKLKTGIGSLVPTVPVRASIDPTTIALVVGGLVVLVLLIKR